MWLGLLLLPIGCAAGIIEELSEDINLAECIGWCNDELNACGERSDSCFQGCQEYTAEVRDQCEVECTQEALGCLESWGACGEYCFAVVEANLKGQ